ncbi:hypothetical protein Q644_12485 [Brucella intermedia 229E]|uniref:Uncharacterized protein n=1 Tax=Brucella intermedia 229E TaxID=1337887 RepID=U4VK08_9HYPH|nr:hypothetical protein Q644_12485 [Brucella intermedia 229E]
MEENAGAPTVPGAPAQQQLSLSEPPRQTAKEFPGRKNR